MLEPGQRTPTPILRQMVGWVLVLPLLVALVKLPFPLGMLLSLGSIAASAHGVWRARHHASRRVTRLAWVVILLNVISWVLISNASVVMALYWASWLYVYPHYAHWVYWNT